MYDLERVTRAPSAPYRPPASSLDEYRRAAASLLGGHSGSQSRPIESGVQLKFIVDRYRREWKRARRARGVRRVESNNSGG